MPRRPRRGGRRSARRLLVTRITRLPPDVARKLGYYVYLYINPLDGRIFYVGKGRGSAVSETSPLLEAPRLCGRP
jgi:hypothetical protein